MLLRVCALPGANAAGLYDRHRESRRLMGATLFTWILIASLVATPSIAGEVSTLSSLQTAAEFLWQKQAADGGWHSEHYAVLRSGQSLTPFVLFALMQVPDDAYTPARQQRDRALEFVRNSVDEGGAIGLGDPDLLDYPNYSTAYAVRTLLLAGNPTDQPLVKRMIRYLVAAQYVQAHGFDDSHVAYGGWGFAAPRRPGIADHMDLAHTRCVLEALAEADAASDQYNVDEGVLQRATVFLRLLQRSPDELRPHPIPVNWLGTAEDWNAGARVSFDGGFYFSPVVLTANKGGFAQDPPHWRSYATATSDGILALLATGTSLDDPRVQAALNWLDRHSDLDYPEGVPRDHPEPWGDSIRFYHYASRAAVFRRIGPPNATEATRLRQLVAARQRPDGSFVNSGGHLMKEDDPLLGTALAVLALAQ